MKKRKKLGKKGLFLSIPYITMILFAIAIIIFCIHKAFTEIHTDIESGLDQADATEVLAKGQVVMNGFDYLFILMLIGTAIFLVASIFMLDTNPLFFVIMIILIVIMIIVSFVMSEAFGDISGEADMANATATFPMVVFVMDKYPLFILFFGIIGAIAFYAKSRMGG
jgi:hypothetical protein